MKRETCSVAEVAERLGIAKGTVTKLGLAPVLRNPIRYRIADVDSILYGQGAYSPAKCREAMRKAERLEAENQKLREIIRSCFMSMSEVAIGETK